MVAIKHPIGYEDVVQKLECLGVFPDRLPSLEPMKKGLERLQHDLKIDPNRVIVVAGTNGKGSVCATLEALLLSAGQTVGLYTSPHLVETTERFRINGQDISREEFCSAYQAISEKIADLKLTHFEWLTLMAAWIFFHPSTTRPEWAILEVGLGGLWDATNAIDHQFCVITTLGFDHENFLGNRIEDIAFNKFGIVRTGCTVVHSPLPGDVDSLKKKVRNDTQSQWIENIPFELEIKTKSPLPEFFINTEFGNERLNLPGQRGALNTATALTLFRELGFNPSSYLNALRNVRWPGRMDLLPVQGSSCPVFISGDHNPQGIQSLVEILKYYRRNRLYILAGIAKDKDRDQILKPLFSLRDTEVFLTVTPFRGRPLSEYGHWLNLARGSAIHPYDAFHQILATARPGDLIVVTGSLYLVGYLVGFLRNMEKHASGNH